MRIATTEKRMKITFVTGNRKKFEEVELILDQWELEQADLDVPEIQGTRQEVIEAKSRAALEMLGRPLIVEDVSLCCSALNGRPGPYVKHFLEAIDAEGLYDLIHRYDDHGVQAICMAAYIEPGNPPIICEGVINGQIVAPAGETKHGKHSFNQILLPDGHSKTMGEMSMEEHAECSHRRLAFLKLKQQLEALGVS